MKKKLLTISIIVNYIFTAIYGFTTALFYSMSNKLYFLFFLITLIVLISNLFLESYKTKLLANRLNKKDHVGFIIVNCLLITTLVSFVLCLLVLMNNKEEQYELKPYVIKEKKERKWYQLPCFYLSIISLVLIFVFGFTGHIVETKGFSVVVKDATLTKADTDKYNKDQPLNGTSYTIDDETVSISYTYYKPKDASATNQYPVVFVVPGFTRTKATMSQYAIELTRRGCVVFVIDPGSQGATTYGGYEVDSEGNYKLDENGNKIQNSYSVARSGMGYLLQYVYNNVDKFDYINRDQIGIIGHSAGGGDACKLAADFSGSNYNESIIKALYISGYIKTSAANVFYKLHMNAALSYAKYDEGSFRYQDENQAYEVIGLKFINDINEKDKNGNTYFEEDHEYGDLNNCTYRVIHHEDINHCFEMYDKLSIANTINFFKQCFNLETSLKDNNHVWFLQELSNGLALVCAFTFVIALIYLIIELLPFMKSVKNEAQERSEAELLLEKKYNDVSYVEYQPKTFVKRLLFVLPIVLTMIIACLDYIPLARLSMDAFPEAAGNVYTFKFPARMMNAVFLWALVNGTIGLVLFFGITLIENLYYTIEARCKNIPSRADWSKFKGLKVKPLNLLMTLLLAILMFFAFYGLVAASYALFHQDFRFMLISASPLNKRFLVTWLIYLAGFFVFYISNSIRVNLSIGREGMKEWKVLLISALANSLGLVLIIIINYYVYFKTGTVYYGYYSATDQSEMWLYINMVFPLIVMMGILPIFNRLVYKKTGNVYAGALLWCMIFIMMSLSASISFIPM